MCGRIAHFITIQVSVKNGERERLGPGRINRMPFEILRSTYSAIWHGNLVAVPAGNVLFCGAYPHRLWFG